MKLFDAHAHLTDEKYKDDLAEIIKNFETNNVEGVISAGFDLESSQEALKLANLNSNIFATAGIHPENVVSDFCDIVQLKEILKEDDEIAKEKFFERTCHQFELCLKKIEKICENKKVVAIGEIGLDYHFFDEYNEVEIEFFKELQKFAFKNQIQLANKLKKPIVVHSRDAMGDTLKIIRENPVNRESLLHCYGGSVESAKELIKLGYSFSFGGVVTFKNAKNIQEVVQFLPIEKILLETDCPYLSPEPFRGKRNEPKNLIYIADKIAKIKNVSIEEVVEQTTKNTKRLYDIKIKK